MELLEENFTRPRQVRYQAALRPDRKWLSLQSNRLRRDAESAEETHEPIPSGSPSPILALFETFVQRLRYLQNASAKTPNWYTCGRGASP
jgi:hypothetical protein